MTPVLQHYLKDSALDGIGMAITKNTGFSKVQKPGDRLPFTDDKDARNTGISNNGPYI